MRNFPEFKEFTNQHDPIAVYKELLKYYLNRLENIY